MTVRSQTLDLELTENKEIDPQFKLSEIKNLQIGNQINLIEEIVQRGHINNVKLYSV